MEEACERSTCLSGIMHSKSTGWVAPRDRTFRDAPKYGIYHVWIEEITDNTLLRLPEPEGIHFSISLVR